MAYDESLADRVRPLLRNKAGFEEKKMFGGVGHLLRGNMCVGIWKEFLIVRLGPDAGPAALREPHVRPFDVTGTPMTGWAMVEPEGIETAEELERWVSLAVDFVSDLPAKVIAPKTAAPKRADAKQSDLKRRATKAAGKPKSRRRPREH